MNTGGHAFPGTLLDWMAGQALAGSLASQSKESHWAFAPIEYETADDRATRGISDLCYDIASAMLTEKARREEAMQSAFEKPGVATAMAVHEAFIKDHSGDANKMVPNSPKQHDACALLRKFVDEIEGSDCSGDLWSLRREAISLLDQAPDHSPDAGKMVWKRSPRASSAVVCETQFSDRHSDNSNVLAYGGFLVAESVPPEAMDLIVSAPNLAEINRELVEALDAIVTITDRDHVWWHKARSAITKAKGVA